MKIRFNLTAWLVLTVTIAACGGGSTTTTPVSQQDPAGIEPPPPAVPTKATVAIVLTDASGDDYDHAYVTITSVELLGENGNEQIFSGEETVDLLALRDTVDLFAVNENVEPGEFEKIRMIASQLTLVANHEDGSTTETEVKLVANGKIDLNPRETFSIAAGEIVFISLDWDVNKSLKFTETGNGKIIMRPVIFVEIGTEPAFKEGLVRMSGLVEFVAIDATSFRICQTESTSQIAGDTQLNELCLDIIINDKTGIFGEDGMPAMVSELTKGDPVTVLGLLRRTMDGAVVTPLDGDNGEVEPTPFQILAIVVEGGEPGTWQQLRGSIGTTVDESLGTFDFVVDNGQGLPDDTVLTGHLDVTARIFLLSRDTGITEIAAADLMVDDVALVDGVQVPADDAADPDVLHIAIMLAATPDETDTASIKGEILSIDASAGALRIAADSLDRCVTTDDDTMIFEVLVHDDSVENVPATLEDLTVGSIAFVTGAEDGAGCFAADLIIAEGQAAAP
jgi:hypothetical protein